jgi:hypothetical protein
MFYISLKTRIRQKAEDSNESYMYVIYEYFIIFITIRPFKIIAKLKFHVKWTLYWININMPENF